MCDTSNIPAARRVARCSSTIEAYWTGIVQPAKSTIRPPWAACQAASGVSRSGAVMGESLAVREARV